MTDRDSGAEVAEATDVAAYYDRNTVRFLLMGGGAPSMHRALWAPGVESTRDAVGHVDRLVADELAALRAAECPVVVDYGCGVGGTLFHLASRFTDARLIGITVSPRQVDVATRFARQRGLADRCTFRLGDFQSIDLAVKADAIVAIESFVHSSDPEAFFASAARHLRTGGRLIVVDDFLAVGEDALTVEQRRRVAELRAGWRVPAICTGGRFIEAAAAHGLVKDRAVDLTPLTRPGSRLRDRLTAAVSPLLSRLGLARMPFYGNMIGGSALQVGLGEGFIRYQLMVLSRH
ncbi:MAG: methyltransferase domain-containing protein [Longimicrobiales bacterium]